MITGLLAVLAYLVYLVSNTLDEINESLKQIASTSTLDHALNKTFTEFQVKEAVANRKAQGE